MAAAVDPLSVDVDLAVTVDGRECAVWDEDNRVVINIPSLAVARSMLAGVDTLPDGSRRLQEELVRADLVLEVRIRHSTVARLGADVSPSRLGTLAGYEATVSPRGLLVALWRALL